MLRQAITVLIFAAATLAVPAMADTLIVEGINPQAGSGPASGLTQQKVADVWGQPVSKNAPVGDPPISSWDYEPFVVYFEYDRVIHTVAKR